MCGRSQAARGLLPCLAENCGLLSSVVWQVLQDATSFYLVMEYCNGACRAQDAAELHRRFWRGLPAASWQQGMPSQQQYGQCKT